MARPIADDYGAPGAQAAVPPAMPAHPLPPARPLTAGAAPALGLAAIIVAAEYAARRLLGPLLPTFGSPTTNDMLAFAFVYTPLVALTAPASARTPAALGRALRAIAGQARAWLPWLGAALFLVTVLALVPLDVRLWGAVRLPAVTLPPSPAVLFPGAALPLAAVGLLLVNGLFVPLVEERLWRGLVQPRLRASWGLLPGLLATAALFSLKHAIVDASLGRLLATTAGGLVLGAVALRAGGPAGERAGWRASAVSHVAGNTVATSIFLATTIAG
jgi:membrane protease YdiL (CAAX protease family)